MKKLAAVVDELAWKFNGIDQQRADLKQAIAANQANYKAAEAALDVKGMKAYGRELEEDKSILATLEERRSVTIDQDKQLLQRLTQAARADMEAANGSQEERREKIRVLLQEAEGIMGEIKAEETAAAEKIRAYLNAAVPYADRQTQGLLGRISSMVIFYEVDTQQTAIKQALKQF